MSRNLSPKSRRTAHPPAATEEAPSHDRRLQHEKSVRFEGDEGDIDEEEEEDEGLGVSSGGDSSPANGERDQPATPSLGSSSPPPPAPSSPPIPPGRDRTRHRRSSSGGDTQAHSGQQTQTTKRTTKRSNLPSRLLRRIARSASSVGGGSSTHAQFGMINVVVVGGSRAASALGTGKVFGLDLIAHLRATDRELPIVVESCAESIEKFGMVDGIYRLSGIASNIRALKQSFDNCSESAARALSNRLCCADPASARHDIHSVSSLLKLYCREMPDPLCTFDLYDGFLRAAKVPEEFRLGAMREMVMALPKEHLRTLSFLMRHLCMTSKHSAATGMTAKNLAIVWAPNLLRSRPPTTASSNATNSRIASHQNLEDIAVQAVCTEFLITYCDILFCEDLPRFSSLNFDLGIEVGGDGDDTNEVDIDAAMERAEKKQNAEEEDKDEEGSVDQAVSRNRGISEIEEGLSSIVMSFDKGNDIRTMGSQEKRQLLRAAKSSDDIDDDAREFELDAAVAASTSTPDLRRRAPRRRRTSSSSASPSSSSSGSISCSASTSRDFRGRRSNSHEDKRMTAGGSVTSKPTAASAAAAATKSSKSSSQTSSGIRERLWRQLATIGSSSSNSAAPQPKKSRSLSRMASALSREFLWRKRGNGERNVYMCNAATNTIQTRDAAFSKRADVSRRGSSAATPVQKPHRTRRKAPNNRKSSVRDGRGDGVKSSGGRVGRYSDEEEYIDDGGDSDSSLVQEFSAEWDRIKMSNYGQPATATAAAAATTGSGSASSLLHADSGFESGSPVGGGGGGGEVTQLQSAVGGVYENAAHNQRHSSVESDSSSDTTSPSYQNVDVRKAHFRYGPDGAAAHKVESRRSKRESKGVYQNVSFDSSSASSGPMSLPPMSDRFAYRDDPVVYENCSVVKPGGGSRRGRNGRSHNNHSSAVVAADDVYAKVRLLRQSVQEVNALLEGGGEERLRDTAGERVPRQRRQHRSVPRGGGETPLEALIVPPPTTTTMTNESHKKAVVSTRVTANISGKYQPRRPSSSATSAASRSSSHRRRRRSSEPKPADNSATEKPLPSVTPLRDGDKHNGEDGDAPARQCRQLQRTKRPQPTKPERRMSSAHFRALLSKFDGGTTEREEGNEEEIEEKKET